VKTAGPRQNRFKIPDFETAALDLFNRPPSGNTSHQKQKEVV
jgi:hypothetical protein